MKPSSSSSSNYNYQIQIDDEDPDLIHYHYVLNENLDGNCNPDNGSWNSDDGNLDDGPLKMIKEKESQLNFKLDFQHEHQQNNDYHHNNISDDENEHFDVIMSPSNIKRYSIDDKIGYKKYKNKYFKNKSNVNVIMKTLTKSKILFAISLVSLSIILLSIGIFIHHQEIDSSLIISTERFIFKYKNGKTISLPLTSSSSPSNRNIQLSSFEKAVSIETKCDILIGVVDQQAFIFKVNLL